MERSLSATSTSELDRGGGVDSTRRDHGSLARRGRRPGSDHGGLRLGPLVGDPHHQGDQNVIGDQRRTAVGDEGERDPGQRQEPHHPAMMKKA